MRVRAAARGVARINALAAGAEGHDLIGFAVVAMLHARRSDRHAGDGKALHPLGLFAKQAGDLFRGHMPLAHIAADEQDRKSTRLKSSHSCASRMPPSA